jgi:multisubunit Na+/H+ antiporter MnhG subunit
MTEAAASDQKSVKLPGEEPACLQIAVGTLGTVLLIFASLLSRWRWSHGTSVGVVALLAGIWLVAAGGFRGLKEGRQRRAALLMFVGDLILTISAVTLLIVSFGGTFSWAFPLGAIFTTLALFSDVASYRFRRALSYNAVRPHS